MKALFKPGPQAGFELADRPEPEPGFGEVKIKVLTTGICGTDLHIQRVGRLGRGRGDQRR